MKKLQILSIAAIMLLSACSKQSGSPTPNPSTSTTLVTKIIDNVPADPGYNKSVVEFTYNGKQLTQAVTYDYILGAAQTTTTYFNYNTQGQLTGTTITYSNPNPTYEVKSVVTYTGTNITSIVFYKANNLLSRTATLTYQNGLLTQLNDTYWGSDTYTYDSNGNNTGESLAGLTNLTFDNNNSLHSAYPLWFYFRSADYENYVQSTPGKNNPLTANDGTAFTYSYVYNSNGYPSTITYPGNYSYQYQYTQVAN